MPKWLAFLMLGIAVCCPAHVPCAYRAANFATQGPSPLPVLRLRIKLRLWFASRKSRPLILRQ